MASEYHVAHGKHVSMVELMPKFLRPNQSIGMVGSSCNDRFSIVHRALYRELQVLDRFLNHPLGKRDFQRIPMEEKIFGKLVRG